MKRTVNNLLNCLIVCLLFFSSSSICYGGDTPEIVVKKYYTTDLDGVRLSGKTYDAIRKYVTWEDEPGWDTAFIVDNIHLCKTHLLNQEKASIEVRYHVIAIWSGDEFNTYNFTEIINYVLTKKAGEWKITQPVFPPHVSPQTVIRITKEQIEQLPKIEAKERIKVLEHRIDVVTNEIEFHKKNESMMWFNCSNGK